MPLVSCQKEDVNNGTTQNETVDNNGNGSGNNGGNGGSNNGSENYYFRCIITTILRDWRAGSVTLYFETNLPVEPEMRKNISACSAKLPPPKKPL